MSVEFSNAYQEILLENLMSVIKQNFMIQTQLKLTENIGKEKDELKTKLDEMTSLYNSVRDVANQVDSYRIRAEQNVSANEEKNRIQTALNDSMKKSSSLQKQIDSFDSVISSKNDEISHLKEYIQKLEGIVPVSKLKKINSTKTIQSNATSDSIVVNNIIEKGEVEKPLDDGSTF